MIGAFYGIGINSFGSTEYVWEGVFALLATIVITLVGAALLRVSKLQDKWRVKLANALEKQDITHHTRGSGNRFKLWCEKYAMFMLPFITVLREGLEAVVFIGGVGLGRPASSFPLAVICGLLAGAAVGYLIYRYVQFSMPSRLSLTILQGWEYGKTPDFLDHLYMFLVSGRRR